MTPTRVLLSGDEGTGTLAALRALHAVGYEVWVAVSRDDTYAARSRRAAGILRVTDPGADMDRHARDLADAAERLAVAAVLPGTEGSLRAVTGRGSLFPDRTVVGVGSPESLARATDKWLLMELAAEAGLQAPRSLELTDRAAETISFPAVVKPLRSVDDSGLTADVEAVETIEELHRLRRRLPERGWIIQPRIDGALGAVCGVCWEGELVCAVHQVSPRIWPPRVGISSYAVTTPPDPAREAGVAALVRSIGWSGVFGVQFLLGRDGAYVIDFNPRIYGSLGLAIAAGCNLPAIWVDLLLGRTPTLGRYRPGVGYRVEEDDYRAIAHAFAHRQWREAVLGLLPRRRTAHAVFSLRDPAPLVTSLVKLRGAAAGSRSPERS